MSSIPTTMKQLAELAGLSHASISLILAGKADGRIRKSKQELVHKLACKYNFIPNAAAQGLRTGKHLAVGVLMPVPRDSFYADLVTLLQDEFAKRGYHTLFSFWRDESHAEEAFRLISGGRRVDGILSWNAMECIQGNSIPVVTYQNRLSGCDSVELDFAWSSRFAAKYLRDRGHREIGWYGILEDRRAVELKKALQELELPVCENYFFASGEMFSGYEKRIRRFLTASHRPSAIITHNDFLAVALISQAVQIGLRIPEDLSIIGFNNTVESRHALPALTTFDCNERVIASTLVQFLLQRIKHPPTSEQHKVIRPKPIERQSVLDLTRKN